MIVILEIYLIAVCGSLEFVHGLFGNVERRREGTSME